MTFLVLSPSIANLTVMEQYDSRSLRRMQLMALFAAGLSLKSWSSCFQPIMQIINSNSKEGQHNDIRTRVRPIIGIVLNYCTNLQKSVQLNMLFDAVVSTKEKQGVASQQ